jgi:RNA polymerase sigma-70 factor (ECF subfamily)
MATGEDMPDGRSDADLVLACREGDRPAYGELVERHYRRVVGICLAIMGSGSDAEDAAHNALIRGLEGIAELRDGARFGAWIAQIARNVCLDAQRRTKRDRRLHLEQAERISQARETSSAHDALEHALGQLPAELRSPLVLFHLERRNLKAIGETLSLSPATVHRRLRAARKLLHEILLKERGA